MILDIIFLAALAFGFYRGFSKGLVIAFSSFFAFIIGIILSLKLIPISTEIISEWINTDSVFLPIVSFLVTLIAIIIGINLLARVITMLIKAVQLNLINRITGGLFGLITMALILSFFLWIFNQMELFKPELKETSVLFGFIESVGPQFIKFAGVIFPPLDGLIDTINDFFDGYKLNE